MDRPAVFSLGCLAVWFVLVFLAVMCVLASPRGQSDIRIVTDPVTGCEYLSRRGAMSGLTPRLDRDGRHMCAH